MKSLLAVEKLYKYETFHREENQEAKVKDGLLWIGEEQIERGLSEYLSKLTLLYDVPFAYLVPDEAALPEESIRFFELNPMWVKSLLDGALSIGRNTKRDYSHDSGLIHAIYSGSVKNNMEIRKNLSPENRSRAFLERYSSLGERINDDTRYTGFLLRSSINTDFRGIDFTAWNSKSELPVARLERLGSNVMLGIFMGAMTHMDICQPKESIHLGIGDNGKKTLRKDDGTLDQSLSLPIMSGSCDPLTGKLDYQKIAEGMKTVIHQDKITSADMALQLIQNAYTVRFILKY